LNGIGPSPPFLERGTLREPPPRSVRPLSRRPPPYTSWCLRPALNVVAERFFPTGRPGRKGGTDLLSRSSIVRVRGNGPKPRFSDGTFAKPAVLKIFVAGFRNANRAFEQGLRSRRRIRLRCLGGISRKKNTVLAFWPPGFRGTAPLFVAPPKKRIRLFAPPRRRSFRGWPAVLPPPSTISADPPLVTESCPDSFLPEKNGFSCVPAAGKTRFVPRSGPRWPPGFGRTAKPAMCWTDGLAVAPPVDVLARPYQTAAVKIPGTRRHLFLWGPSTGPPGIVFPRSPSGGLAAGTIHPSIRLGHGRDRDGAVAALAWKFEPGWW